MLRFCLFGAGRIGAVHAANLAAHPKASLRWVVDVDRARAEALAAKHGARAGDDAKEALGDPDTDAVLIASSTSTHAELIQRAAAAGKPIFCEKPIDLDLDRVDRCIAAVERAAVPLLVGFNRRFDPSFSALERAVRGGEVGQVEMVAITSRDPRPPPLDYLRVSGGLFRDMMIHDFDLALWLLGEEPVEVQARASCLVDPAIGGAGDVDSAVVAMRTRSGRLCSVHNSRRAAYGYDQRVEVFGSAGMLQAGNHSATTVSRWGTEGVVGEKPLPFFLERYAAAYRAELEHFVESVLGGRPLLTGPADGRAALALAEAAQDSARTGQVVAPRRAP